VLGANLDSLADLISFGVAPAVLSLGVFGRSWPAVLVALAYLTCGILRLARFNVSKSNSYFEGLPITAAGIAAAASVLADRQIFTLLLMLVLAAFMTSSVPFPKIRDPMAIGAFAVILAASTSLVMLQRDAGCALMLLAITTYLSSPVVVPYLRRER
jgi:CDP-diacylglycerol--serine O-phosphatidyltransferase